MTEEAEDEEQKCQVARQRASVVSSRVEVN